MRLIDADKLIDFLSGYGDEYDTYDAIMWLHDAPTEDAVPVVRCKDCRWRLDRCELGPRYRCPKIGLYVTPGWYCAAGMRKGE